MDALLDTERIQQVSRNALILNDTSDWRNWFQYKKELAEHKDIWELVNPDGLTKLDQQHPEPDRPDLDTYAKAEHEPDLAPEERIMYREDLKQWEKEYARYQTIRKAYRAFSLEILGTVHKKHIHLIASDSDPRVRLQILRDRFSPSEWDRQEQLRVRYDALKRRPKAANLDSWFDAWIEVCIQGLEARMPIFLEDNPHRDFLTAIMPLDEAWSNIQFTELITWKNKGTGDLQPITSLINSYRQLYHMKRPQASSLGTYAASLEVAEPNKKSESKSKEDRQGRELCWCGGSHKLEDCFYLVPDHPRKWESWKPRPRQLELLKKARKADTTQGKEIRRLLD
ncbi:hypothetical protein EJ04DRAFT_489054, partial [Polyplosphaeria fusca]